MREHFPGTQDVIDSECAVELSAVNVTSLANGSQFSISDFIEISSVSGIYDAIYK